MVKKQIIELWDDTNTLQFYEDGYMLVSSGINLVGFDFAQLDDEEVKELIDEMQKHLDKRKRGE